MEELHEINLRLIKDFKARLIIQYNLRHLNETCPKLKLARSLTVMGCIGETNSKGRKLEAFRDYLNNSPYYQANLIFMNRKVDETAEIASDLVFWSLLRKMALARHLDKQIWEVALILYQKCTLLEKPFICTRIIGELLRREMNDTLLPEEKLLFLLVKRLGAFLSFPESEKSRMVEPASIYGFQLRQLLRPSNQDV